MPTSSRHSRTIAGDRNRERGRGPLLAAALLYAALSAPSGARAQSKYSAADVQAQFIERFTRFIEWPASVRERKTFTLCVAGDGATARALKAFSAAREIKQRRVVLDLVGAKDDLDSCWVLFLSNGSKDDARDLLAQVEGKPVLTIGESPGLADAGVMMSFYREGRRVRFAIDADRISSSGLKARSKLLRLGRPARNHR